jgi:WD40 repeat protein
MSLRFWDLESGKEARHLDVDATHVAINGDATRLYTSHSDAHVKFWDLTAKKPEPQTPYRYNTRQIDCLALSPDGKRLVSGDSEQRIVLWDAEKSEKIREWKQPSPFNQLLFAPDSRHLAIANTNGTIYILRLPDP